MGCVCISLWEILHLENHSFGSRGTNLEAASHSKARLHFGLSYVANEAAVLFPFLVKIVGHGTGEHHQHIAHTPVHQKAPASDIRTCLFSTGKIGPEHEHCRLLLLYLGEATQRGKEATIQRIRDPPRPDLP